MSILSLRKYEPRPMPGKPEPDKTLMRSLGEFFGHIWAGVRTDPAKLPDSEQGVTRRTRRVVDRSVTEEKRGKTTLRETVIREIEFDDDDGDDEQR